MFSDAQTTLDILVTLEDAFIAAYLVGVRNFSTADLRVTAARIMGIESDHRTLARVVAPGVAAADGGPIETVTGMATGTLTYQGEWTCAPILPGDPKTEDLEVDAPGTWTIAPAP